MVVLHSGDSDNLAIGELSGGELRLEGGHLVLSYPPSQHSSCRFTQLLTRVFVYFSCCQSRVVIRTICNALFFVNT